MERLSDAAIQAFTRLRRDIHQHPELAFNERRTAALVAAQLGAWGYEVITGLGGTGVVGQLKRGSSGRTLGLRADMDALPMQEATGLPYASTALVKDLAGKDQPAMHACAHDGHPARVGQARIHGARVLCGGGEQGRRLVERGEREAKALEDRYKGKVGSLDGAALAEAIAAYSIIVTVNQGLPAGLSRLPGQATAESKLATLRNSSSNPSKPQ